ncbi:MAG: hypothetical protein AAB074_06400 [Planctomycetota bacterium]
MRRFAIAFLALFVALAPTLAFAEDGRGPGRPRAAGGDHKKGDKPDSKPGDKAGRREKARDHMKRHKKGRKGVRRHHRRHHRRHQHHQRRQGGRGSK